MPSEKSSSLHNLNVLALCTNIHGGSFDSQILFQNKFSYNIHIFRHTHFWKILLLNDFNMLIEFRNVTILLEKKSCIVPVMLALHLTHWPLERKKSGGEL